MSENIIREVVARTKGEIYLGVVGPVRSGKSTFIRKFMEQKVLPYIDNEDTYKKVVDELPLSGDGKTITTVEPKFIPSNNMNIRIDDSLNINIRLVDCVGYIINSAKGYLNEDGTNRLVQTPWFTEAIPFNEAAGLGTKKVIEAHSNIGVLVSSDGSFGEFTREEYEVVEEKMVNELKSLNKPFVLVINTKKPNDESTNKLVNELTNKYEISVIALDILNMTSDDVDKVLKEALNEFDISELNIEVPNWIDYLDDDVPFKNEFNTLLKDTTANYRKMKDAFRIQESLKECEYFKDVEITSIDSGTGIVNFDIKVKDECYLNVIESIMGASINDKGQFIESLQRLNMANKVYEKVGNLDKVYQVGYDFIIPPISEMKLSEPVLSKQNGRYGVKINANAEALLIAKVDVESSFDPIIGSMEQSQILVDHMKDDFLNDPDKLWNVEIFGRKLSEVISDGIKIKVSQIPDVVLQKYNDGITKIVNQNKGGVIAIVI